ncbi:MAG: hypothetical protein HYW48_05905 [Deltaproteobacteria bacterium]|nr:hypothetical protein [Deltaproteobacteria bacterium]
MPVSFKMSELEELLDILREADIGEEAWAAIQESPEACAKYFLPVVKMVAEKSGIDDPVKFTSEFCKEAKATGSLVRSLTTFLGGVKTPSIKSVVAGVGAATLIVIAIRWFRP